MKKSILSLLCAALLIPLFACMFIACEQDDPSKKDDPDPKPKPEDSTEVIVGKYAVSTVTIEVENRQEIVSKLKEDYLNCTITIDGKGMYPDYSGTGRIRGRGNSSWLWYDKKPYRIKLDEKSEILGLGRNSDWVLLANYRDPTDLMNTFGFEVSQWLGLPFTNHTRYVEVTLNGDYIGLYQLTEQVEQGGNRVNVANVGGLLLSLDLDDGPDLSPENTDNFYSSVYWLPVCVKYPKEQSPEQLSAIRDEFAVLEDAVLSADYDAVAELMDIPSFINYLLVEELVYNVEIDAPRSTFIHKDVAGKWTWGPVWDFDAGFDFDWGTMYDGHNFFMQQEFVLGTDPVRHTWGYRINDFFTNMFSNERFVTEFKARWNEVKGEIVERNWSVMEDYIESIAEAMQRDAWRWPIDKDYEEEYDKMEKWLFERVSVLDEVINGYPAGYSGGGGQIENTKDCGELSYDISLVQFLGYHQDVQVVVDKAELAALYEVSEDALDKSWEQITIVPLNNDGSVGENNTNGVYGAWFNSDGEPRYWAEGHIYIEIFEDLYNWNIGVHPDNCFPGDTHTVRMQYRFVEGTTLKTVTVAVKCKVE